MNFCLEETKDQAGGLVSDTFNREMVRTRHLTQSHMHSMGCLLAVYICMSIALLHKVVL